MEITASSTWWPTKLNKEDMTEDEWVKYRTLELYEFLPQTSLEERFEWTNLRDEIVRLNYKFFGYVASHTFINNSSISYEDKFQSACLHFCEMWHKYKFAAKYRTDLSFAVFFKPRVGECIERELNEVKYSLRRSLCMKAGEQLGKHWGQVKYDDLKDVNLPPEDMQSLQAMFGSMYVADLETHALFIESTTDFSGEEKYYSENYNTIEEMLIHEMVSQEKKLDDKDLLELSVILDISYFELKNALPQAEETLHKMLEDELAIKQDFN